MFRSLRREFSRHLTLWIILLTGVFLRIHYVLSTPFAIRSYDTSGHLNYILYVLNKWSIPASWSGWEMHQPPLYYFLAAFWVRGKMLFFNPADPPWFALQWLSFLISVLTLCIALWIARLLFPKPSQQTQAALFLGIIASLPGLVFMSSRISNDPLLTLLLFAFTGVLLAWWKSGKDRWWYGATVLGSIAILTKMSAAFTLPLLLICLWLRGSLPRKEKWIFAITAVVIVISITAWLFVIRLLDGSINHLVTPGNISLNRLLTIPLGAQELLSFSPIRILSTTYNDPWTDMYGRKYFWEFFFKSAFFGEWRFLSGLRFLHRTMLLGGLLTLLLSAIGIVRDIRRRGSYRTPLLLILGSGCALLFLLRIIHSAGCSQDFRYVPQVIIPIAAYACIGLDALAPRWRTTAIAALTTFCIVCGMFILSIPLLF